MPSRSDRAPPLEPRVLQAGSENPEAHLVQRLIDGEEPERLSPFLVDDGRIFVAVGCPMVERDRFKGLVVLGTEVTDGLAKRIQELQAEGDEVAYVVGDRIAAASFVDPRREEAAGLVAQLRKVTRQKGGGQPNGHRVSS